MKFNDRYFEDLLNSAEVDQLTKAAATEVRKNARASAPVDQGDYKRGIVLRRKQARHRPVWLVVGTDPKTLLIEAKTGNLLRALRRRQR